MSILKRLIAYFIALFTPQEKQVNVSSGQKTSKQPLDKGCIERKLDCLKIRMIRIHIDTHDSTFEKEAKFFDVSVDTIKRAYSGVTYKKCKDD